MPGPPGARIAGAVCIIAVDPVADRRKASLVQGATHAVDPNDTDPVEVVKSLTQGRGADYSFEVVGRPELMVQAYNCTRSAGTVVFVGMPPLGSTLTLPAMSAVFSGKRIIGSAVGGAQIRRDFPRFISLAESGKLDLGSLVSQRIGLAEINAGIEMMERADGVRVMIV